VEPAWMEPQYVLDFYRLFLTLLVVILSTSACVGILTSVMLLLRHPKREHGDGREWM